MRWQQVSSMGMSLLLVVLIGCSPNVALHQVYGTYVAKYPFGTNSLILNRDGTYVQRVAIENEQPVEVKGNWTFDSGMSHVDLRGPILIVVGSTGRLLKDWQTPKASSYSLPVEMWWFRTRINSAAYYPYDKQ